VGMYWSRKGWMMMSKLNRKLVAGLVAGALLLGGGLTAYQFQATHTEAAQSAQAQRPLPPQVDAAKAAARIAETFGVDESQVKAAIDSQRDFRDIGQAAMLAKLSGKSFQDVLAMKTDSNKWSDVCEKLGITREQERTARDTMMAKHICQEGNIDESTAVALLQNGYMPPDIASAAALAKTTGKDIQSVLDLKKINNRWRDVAKQLGVDDKTLQQVRRGPGFGPADDEFCDGPQGGPPPDDAFCGGLGQHGGHGHMVKNN